MKMEKQEIEAPQQQPDNLSDLRPDWLKALAEKVWNLELIISGAAIFISLELPRLVDSLLYYYQQHLSLKEGLENSMLPLLAYAFARVIALILPLAFILHFVLRAFWAGLVGLHTVFPQGIRYEHLPSQTDYTRGLMKKNFGLLSDYILRLDRLCNQVFAIAFTVALFGFGIGFIYLLIFFFSHILPLLLGVEFSRTAQSYILIGFGILAIGMALLNKLAKNKYVGRWPKLVRYSERLFSWMPQIMLPFVYRPIGYLNMTFSSNIPKKKYYFVLISVGIVFYVGIFAVLKSVFGVIKDRTEAVNQSYFAKYRNRYSIDNYNYDNRRPENGHPGMVSVPDEIIEGPFLRVFVAYPKWLDATIAAQCVLPNLEDSLPRAYWRIREDSLRVECFRHFLRVEVNDSLYQTQWVFQQHPDHSTLGLVTFLPTGGFRQGQNLLSVQAPSASKSDSLRVLGELPFWYGGNKNK